MKSKYKHKNKNHWKCKKLKMKKKVAEHILFDETQTQNATFPGAEKQNQEAFVHNKCVSNCCYCWCVCMSNSANSK